MDNTRTLNRMFETLAWGLLFILWGITVLFDFLPAGVGILGTGLILLGLNAARWLNGIPAKGGTTVCGILTLVWGGLDLTRSLLYLPFKLSDWAILAILLIVLGVILFGRELWRVRQTGFGGLR